MPQRSILVAVDVENQTASNKRRLQSICSAASFLANRLGAGSYLLYVEDVKAFSREKTDSSQIRPRQARHQEILKALSKQFPEPVFGAIKRGSPAEQILKASQKCELVALGTHGRTGLRRLLVGSVAEEVIRHAKRPVMVVGPMAQERDRDFTSQKAHSILVATDLGKNSRAAERYALSLGRRIGARVVLFHCLWDTINDIVVNTAFSEMAPYRIDEIVAETRDDAAGILKQKVSFFRTHGVRSEYRIQDKAVLSRCGVYQEAEQDFSMIIMGTRGRNALLNAFFGSTARETILNASVPVITVHSG